MGKKSKNSGRSRKKTSLFKKALFIVSVGFVSFLTYKTYSEQVGSFNIPAGNVRHTQGVVNAQVSSQGHLAGHVAIEPPVTPILPKPIVAEPRPTEAMLPLPPRKKVWTSQPKIVFVIDDIGHNRNNEASLKRLSNHVTYAVLPKLSFSEHFSYTGQMQGTEVILHQPLESKKGVFPGPGLIVQKMTESQIRKMLDENLKSVPYHQGINNHMGSLGSSDERIMGIILKDLKKRGVFFLDSRTTAESVSEQLGPKIGIPVVRRDIFLDNVDEQQYVREQVYEAVRIAREKGLAIAIGHDRHNTLTVLYEEIPKIQEQGIQIVSLQDVIKHRG